MAGTGLAPGANLVNDEWFNFGGGFGVGGTGRIPWNPGDIRDPFTFGNGPMTPAEAQAAIANAVANPITPVPWTRQGPRYRNGYHIEDVRIQDQQEQKPENPGRRYVSASTWGRTVPISMGRRRLEGNLLQSTPLDPVLEGTTEYSITYEIPIYEDPPLKPGGAVTITYPGDDRPRPTGPQSGCEPRASSPCDTRTIPTGPESSGWTVTGYISIIDSSNSVTGYITVPPGVQGGGEVPETVGGTYNFSLSELPSSGSINFAINGDPFAMQAYCYFQGPLGVGNFEVTTSGSGKCCAPGSITVTFNTTTQTGHAS